MKSVITFVCGAVCATSLQAAVNGSTGWSTNEVVLLPKKPFGGYEPVLLVGEIPKRKPQQWNVMSLKTVQGSLIWDVKTIRPVPVAKLRKFPIRKQIVVDTFDCYKGELYAERSYLQVAAPFINVE